MSVVVADIDTKLVKGLEMSLQYTNSMFNSYAYLLGLWWSSVQVHKVSTAYLRDVIVEGPLIRCEFSSVWFLKWCHRPFLDRVCWICKDELSRAEYPRMFLVSACTSEWPGVVNAASMPKGIVDNDEVMWHWNDLFMLRTAQRHTTWRLTCASTE